MFFNIIISDVMLRHLVDPDKDRQKCGEREVVIVSKHNQNTDKDIDSYEDVAVVVTASLIFPMPLRCNNTYHFYILVFLDHILSYDIYHTWHHHLIEPFSDGY